MNNTNAISKILKIIGIATAVIGIIASLILGNSADEISITIGGIIGSIISGMLFVGFSEVINLLQQNVDNQEKVLKLLKEQPKATIKESSANNKAQSISNQNSVKHLFRCENCDKMIEKYPCCECGFECKQ